MGFMLYLIDLRFSVSILREILIKKRERLERTKRTISLPDIRRRAEEAEPARDFEEAIKRLPGDPLRFIGEIKKSSPLKGILREDFDIKKIAETYEGKKVHAVSVLTEEDFFSGSLDYLQVVKGIVRCPVLRKDFIVEEYQIYETKAYEGDALLLIASVLSKNQAGELLHLAGELGIAVLFEVHTYQELDMAMDLDCKIIGINNRNLHTLKIDLNTTLDLIKDIPRKRITVSESGINKREDVKIMEKAGVHAILVGTYIMESPDMGKAIDSLRSD